jgi:hypothetical protein
MAGCKYDSNVDNDNNSYLVGIGFVFRAILGGVALGVAPPGTLGSLLRNSLGASPLPTLVFLVV